MTSIDPEVGGVNHRSLLLSVELRMELNRN
jgi:hypothetical protein